MHRRSRPTRQHPTPRPPVRGKVIEVIPARKYMEGIVERMSAEVVVVRDEKGEVHNFITGSLNGIPPTYRAVDVTGTIKWVRTSTLFLPYFQAD